MPKSYIKDEVTTNFMNRLVSREVLVDCQFCIESRQEVIDSETIEKRNACFSNLVLSEVLFSAVIPKNWRS